MMVGLLDSSFEEVCWLQKDRGSETREETSSEVEGGFGSWFQSISHCCWFQEIDP